MLEKKTELLKTYFKVNANGWNNRKSIQDLQVAINTGNRETRHIIEILRSEHGELIVSDLKNGGYFLLREDNLFDRAVAKRFLKSQRHRIYKIWRSIKAFDKIFPENQLKFDFEVLNEEAI